MTTHQIFEIVKSFVSSAQRITCRMQGANKLCIEWKSSAFAANNDKRIVDIIVDRNQQIWLDFHVSPINDPEVMEVLSLVTTNRP